MLTFATIFYPDGEQREQEVGENEKERWGACMGVVHHLGHHGVGSFIKPNCAANEIADSTNASTAMTVVMQ